MVECGILIAVGGVLMGTGLSIIGFALTVVESDSFGYSVQELEREGYNNDEAQEKVNSQKITWFIIGGGIGGALILLALLCFFWEPAITGIENVMNTLM